MTKEEIVAKLRASNIEYVLAQFVDIHGAAKAKAVPLGASCL